MRIVGVDASLTSTGIAVINENNRQETLTIQSKNTGSERLIEIRKKLLQIVDDADLVVIEDYAFARANQAHQIGELGGVLRVMFHELGLNVLKVAPSAVKKFATGKGVASKEQMAVAVYKRWGKEFATNDEADAYTLAIIGQVYFAFTSHDAEIPTALTAFQKEVIQQLINGKQTKKKKSNKKGS